MKGRWARGFGGGDRGGIITDGHSQLKTETIKAANTLTQIEGVSWFAVGIGPEVGSRCAASLSPIATSMVHVARLDDPEPIVDVINLEKKEERITCL